MIGRVPFASLPEYYVVKPNLGFSRKGVSVMAAGTDLMRGSPLTSGELRKQLRQVTGGVLGVPILIEEFVTTESGEYKLPTEYKCHVFEEKIGAIQVIHRSANARDTRQRIYTAGWKIFEDPMDTAFPPGDAIDPPQCLEEMLTYARKLGKAYGTYVRVDLYASRGGCVFGEFSSTPGRGTGLTRHAEEYFGALWQEAFPDRI
jgi:hypothetical protein